MSIQQVQGMQASPIKKTAKTAAKTAVAAGLVATGLVVGHKTDAFVKLSGKIGDKAGKFKPAIDKVLTKAGDAGKFHSEKADVVKGKVTKAFNTLGDKVEGKFNANKFNPDAAGAAEKTAETFNNFEPIVQGLTV